MLQAQLPVRTYFKGCMHPTSSKAAENMSTHANVADLDTGALTRLASLAVEAARLARTFSGHTEREYVALAAVCSAELWRRRKNVVARCGTLTSLQ